MKAWKKYESIETNILKPKTEDDLEFLQLPKFVKKDQDDGDKKILNFICPHIILQT